MSNRYEEDLLRPFNVRRVQPTRRAKELQVSYVDAARKADRPIIRLISDEMLMPSPASSETSGDDIRESPDDIVNASFEIWFQSIWNVDLV